MFYSSSWNSLSMKAMYHCQFEVSVMSQKYKVLYTKLNYINHSVIHQMQLYDPTERSSFWQNQIYLVDR